MPETKEVEISLKPLAASLPSSAALMMSKPTEEADDLPVLKLYASERAGLLFGCYRKGDANDPDTYTAAVTAVLSRYPRDVITAVTHPSKGLPIKSKFLPNVAEVYAACEEMMSSRREQDARRKRIETQLAERAEFEKRNAVFQRDSVEAKAVKVLHDIVGRTSAFFQIFRRADGSVTYTKEITEQLATLGKAPEQSAWVKLSRQQAGAWEALLRKVFDAGLIRQYLSEGSQAPWPWPPSIEGKIYTDPGGVPPLTEDDINNFKV